MKLSRRNRSTRPKFARRLLWGIAILLLTGPVFPQDITIYTTTGCPYCGEAREFLQTATLEHPGFHYEEKDLSRDPQAVTEFFSLIEQHALERPAVPLMLIGNRVIVGFRAPETPALVSELLGWRDQAPAGPDLATDQLVPDWLSVDRFGLPVFTVILGLMDGFNPCAMWVLMFLLSMLVHVRSRQRMFLIAGIFVLISGIVYFLFMAAWLNLFLAFRWSSVLRILIGLLGLTAALFHLKDFFFNLEGPSLSISESRKSRVGAWVHSVITARNLPLAIMAVAILAVVVNFYELLCTAGLPAIYTQILVNQNMEGACFYGYLLLYNLAYVFDDSLMVFSATWALSSKRLTTGTGRILKGLSGFVLLLLSCLLLFKPEWLSFTL